MLIVDDNKDAARSLAMLLEMGGHEVRRCYDGQSALAEADDVSPGGGAARHRPARHGRARSGAAAARRPDLSPQPLAGGPDRLRSGRRLRRSREAGFDHHLVKPADPQTLMALLDILPAVASRR